MVETFKEWVKTQPHPCLEPWIDRLLELGTSWDSFRRRNSKEVVDDLVAGGIPLLAARDIVNTVKEKLQKSQAPMAIFWDIENLPIPSFASGRDVATRLKSILAPHGNLVQFRGYASIGEASIPQQKRSDLQLSGCHLVDCPHVGRKEVVDKMIIVDAMYFAFTNPEAATICFITGDVDYAYLLAVLQQKPQWRTVVISKGTSQSMLHVNCDLKIRWETDVLQMNPEALTTATASPPVPPPGFEAKRVQDAVDGLGPKSSKSRTKADEGGDEEGSINFTTNLDASSRSLLSFGAPTNSAATWDEDIELLRKTIEGAAVHDRNVLKSFVGNSLRQANPVRFYDRDTVQEFLEKAIAKGVVIETGEGASKALCLDWSPSSIPIYDRAPISFHEMPGKFFEVASSKPYLLFVSWSHYPKGSSCPEKAYFQTSKKYAILMFRKLNEVWRSTQVNPSLRKGKLVDWRKIDDAKKFCVAPTISRQSKPGQTAPCTICGQPNSQKQMMMWKDGRHYCVTCSAKFTPEWNSSGKRLAIEKVVKLMDTFDDQDDVYVDKALLRKFLVGRWPKECPTRAHAGLWIHEAIEDGILVRIQRPDAKAKPTVCLSRLYQEAFAAMLVPFESPVDTSKEETHIENMLWNGVGRLTKVDAISSLKAVSSRMKNSRVLRTAVFSNASQNGRFFVGKGPWGHTVVLNKQDVMVSLEHLIPQDFRQEQSEEE